MRYSKVELVIEDIMWFGIDKNGYVFEADLWRLCKCARLCDQSKRI